MPSATTAGEYEFTEHWFEWGEKVWAHLILHLPARLTMLELGAFEGRASVWIGANMLTRGGELVCVDTWEGSEEHTDLDFAAVEHRFERNQRLFHERHADRRITKIKATSHAYLAAAQERAKATFDFIYVDASHTARDVLTDACLAWPLLKPGGIMAFDDYLWTGVPNVLHQPKIAVDAFTTIFSEDLRVVQSGYQMIVQKRAD